jgi:superfamily II DNA/RNA helicase
MGRDVFGCAQTGTGKTASFVLPMIDILDAGRAKARMPRSLILCPTRELAAQVADNFGKYGKNHKLTMALLIGGVSFDEQLTKLDRGVDVLIATPGRLLDHFERGKVLLNDVKLLVIDEADRMLDMGFMPDVDRIVSLLPKIRQTLFFSATLTPDIRKIADRFLMNPKEITVAPPASTADTVTQAAIVVGVKQKREALRRLLVQEEVANALIFCNRKRDIGVLHRSLERHGFDVGSMHGDLAQSIRTETLTRFKAGEIRLLVCSDVAARGLDIKGLSHVFNFDVPINSEDYVHRIGRTGRAGKEGRAFTIATPEESKYLASIERLIGKKIERVSLDGLAAAPDTAEDDAAGTSSSRGRSSSRSRGGRRDERPARAPRAAAPRAAEPVEPQAAELPAAEQPVAAEAERRPDRPKRTDRPRRRAAAPKPPVEATEQPNYFEPAVADDVEPDEERVGSYAAGNGGRVASLRQPAPAGDRRRGNGRRDEEIGLGDHVPAFLLRPSRPAA